MTESDPHNHREEQDQSVEAACAAGDYDRATTIVIKLYGPEVLGFMVSRVGPSRAQDPFQDFSIKLWSSWKSFKWNCSLRTWVYTIARSVLINYVRRADHRPERNLGLSHASLSKLVDEVRSSTLAYLRSEVKTKARHLREQLSADDQELLTLRVDKEMSYREIAFVQQLCTPEDDADLIKRMEARVRQRFKDTRQRLEKLAKSEGLVDEVKAGR